ncbi:STAS domain-containing protein [Actinotalea sp. K2]|uniref:STAS domain-containing protein n=1 Tax=Actinotalea sp. K2 TaxID=2939438 RepID=UPI0020171C9D|nr:STAS domain-containing protein [Actinotalea sp. K2]MCL3862391.1 STAS domain-containing protein [Actinotalea sp. K2]
MERPDDLGTITVTQTNAATITHLCGEIGTALRAEASSAMSQMLQRDLPMVLDLSGTTSIDSAGLAFVIQCAKNGRDQGLDVTLATQHGPIRDLLLELGLTDSLTTSGRPSRITPEAGVRATCTLVRARGMTVSVRYLDRTHAVLRLGPPPVGGVATTASWLVCEAMSQARSHGITEVSLTLELAQPLSVHVLAGLRGRIGTDLDALDLRRAGSSVIVTATLLDR